MKSKKQTKRVLMALVGVSICGFSVGLFKMSLFGTDPFQCFSAGVSNMVSFIGFGTLYMIMNLVMLLAIFILDRHYIGIATFINIFGIGYIVEFTTKWLNQYFSDANLMTRIILLIVGVILMCMSASLYFTADLGVSTYDAIALILADKKIAKFKYIRIATDLICVIIGALLHAVVGIGTLITAFFMGPLIEFFNVHVSKPFLDRD